MRDNEKTIFAGVEVKNRLVAASSPLTESLHRLTCCENAGFGTAILKTCMDYVPSGNGYPRRVINEQDGFYADGSFESEIHTLKKSLELYEAAKARCHSMHIIPSVTAGTFDANRWINMCRCFAERGAEVIQLDFFYFGTLLKDDMLYDKLDILFEKLSKESYKVMPKLNINLDADKVCSLMKKWGINQVSLLDSIRKTPPESYNLHKETTSFFGKWQLPKTIEYLSIAKRYGLMVCAGGGVYNNESLESLFSEGADFVQIASYVLTNGFVAMKELECNKQRDEINWSSLANEKAWCDYSVTGVCENCGGCVKKRKGVQLFSDN